MSWIRGRGDPEGLGMVPAVILVVVLILGAVLYWQSRTDEAEEEKSRVERIAEREQNEKESLDRIVREREASEAALAEYRREFRSLSDKQGKRAADHERLTWLGAVISEMEACLLVDSRPAHCR